MLRVYTTKETLVFLMLICLNILNCTKFANLTWLTIDRFESSTVQVLVASTQCLSRKLSLSRPDVHEACNNLPVLLFNCTDYFG